MKKRIIRIIIFIVLPVMLICYINTLNFGLGSNTMYYKTIFDYPNSVWISEDPQLEIKVPSDESKTIMRVKTNSGETKEFEVHGMTSTLAVFKITEHNGIIHDEDSVMHTVVKYKKNIFGKATSFTMYQFNKDDLFHHRYQKITFHRA